MRICKCLSSCQASSSDPQQPSLFSSDPYCTSVIQKSSSSSESQVTLINTIFVDPRQPSVSSGDPHQPSAFSGNPRQPSVSYEEPCHSSVSFGVAEVMFNILWSTYYISWIQVYCHLVKDDWFKHYGQVGGGHTIDTALSTGQEECQIGQDVKQFPLESCPGFLSLPDDVFLVWTLQDKILKKFKNVINLLEQVH